MIQIETIEVEDIRGIRRFKRDLNKLSLGIQGPNGSGKSGLIDATEFGLTGKLTRLTGRGTKSLTTKQHGKHVAARDGKVTIEFYVPEQNRSIKVTRSTKAPTKPIIEPDDERARAVIEEVASHPEIALTRRQIIRFILTESKDRSAELRALLRLDKLQIISEELRKASGKCDREAESDVALLNRQSDSLSACLQIKDVSDESILKSVNQNLGVLGEATVQDFDEFLAQDDPSKASKEVNKSAAVSEVNSVASLIADQTVNAHCGTIESCLDQLDSDPALALALARHQLYRLGLDAIDGDACPLCDDAWEQDKLIQHLTEKKSQSEEAKKIQDAIRLAADELASRFHVLGEGLRQLATVARQMKREGHVVTVKSCYHELTQRKQQLETHEGIVSIRHWLSDEHRFAELQKAIDTLRTSIAQLPDQSATETSRVVLRDARRLLREYLDARVASEKSASACRVVRGIYDEYRETSESVLDGLYSQVKQEFESFYRFLNSEDEDDFTAEFNASENSLEIKAKFYGHGNHPPAAFHSEGHQDAMGLCLYLALMKQVFDGNVQLLILDDVVMSIDNGHRRKICELLNREFPDTQFIITTHERTWFKQMQTSKLISTKAAIQFSSWSVESGPQIHDVGESFDRIYATLASGEVQQAAWMLRNHIEFVSCELADALGAEVPFRADSGHDAGELFSSVCKRFRQLLKESATASRQWKRKVEADETLELEKRFGLLLMEINDQKGWMINPAVHFNWWEDFTPGEFKKVVDAYKELLDCCTCATCKSMVQRSSRTNCRDMSCNCGQLTFRFVKPNATEKVELKASDQPELKLHASE